MRSYAVNCLQMLCVHEQSHQLIGIVFQPEQHAQPHIVNAACHGTIHCLGVIVVVVFRSGGMQLFIALFVIGLLEQDIGADSCLFQHMVFFFCGGGDVHIDPADRSVFVVDVIDGVDALQNVGDRSVQRIFACLNGEPFVSHVLQSGDFPDNVLLGQLFPGNMLVLGMIRTICTSVDAVVGQIQRRKDDDAAAVEVQLDLPCQPVHLLCNCLILAEQQHRSLPVVQPLAQRRLCQDLR